MGKPLEAVLRRDRLILIAALAALCLLAWFALIRLREGMDMRGTLPAGDAAMQQTHMGAGSMLGPEFQAWGLAEFLLMFAMWAVMMVGMMVPSAAPMILLYARVGRQAQAKGDPFAASGWFASGYLLAWSAFALLATLLQWGLEQAALLTPMMESASATFGGILLLAAGLYQWTRFKEACLRQCQAPLVFIQRHGGFRSDARGALAMGLRHGIFCIGCCWGLMLLLFVGGVMNLIWIAALAALALAEKVLPHGRLVARAAGLLFGLAGLAMIAGTFDF